MNPSNTPTNKELRELYRRCDVSNNGTLNPISEHEFVAAIEAYAHTQTTLSEQSMGEHLVDMLREMTPASPEDLRPEDWYKLADLWANSIKTIESYLADLTKDNKEDKE